MKKFVLLCSTAAFVMPAAAYAQSTGTVDFEEEAIVVTGTRARDVGGVEVPDTTKAKAVISKELIEHQQAGQTILNVVNLVPSVNFTNSDPYGSSGGNIRIRGFDGNRISLTFDGVPLNDSGNYAIFSSQQLDPELVDTINVGLGVTDVDSPTASAAGGTINYRTIVPTDEMGARLSGSVGMFDYYRAFGLFNTGTFTSIGTKAWIAASRSQNDKFKGPGEIKKTQFNARIYQPIGTNGDFVSVAGHYNRSRNNFYRNPGVNDLRTVFGSGEILANASATADDPIRIGYFNDQQEESFFHDPRLENDAVCASSNRTFSGCSNFFGIRLNPSNTGNIRGSSRFTLGNGLTLTIDPSFQYVLANGGGSFTLAENSARARGGTPASPGVDFNGDGDFGDTVRFYTPNITNTHRYGLTSSLIYDIAPDHRVRVAYTYDRARHRQTGEWSYLQDDGHPFSPFSGRNEPDAQVFTADGFALQQRDRRSIALLNQISGQYIGKFMQDALRVEVGVRRPFFKRNLETFCHIQARDGFAYCTSEPESTLTIIEQGDPVPSSGNPLYAPFKSKYKFGKVLPNVGFTYNVSSPVSIFASYAKGFSAPRTDNLYRAPVVDVKPEETNAFDLGARYTTGKIQAQVAAWKIDYKNRIVSSFNQDLGISLDRNVGKVKSWGLDGSVAVRPVRGLTLLALASYIDTELKDNVELGSTSSATPPAGLIFCDGVAPTPGNLVSTCAPTKGKFVTETPEWQYGGRVQYEFGPFEFGLQGKHVGSRFATDVNDVKVKGYTIFDADVRISTEPLGLPKSYLQINLQNVFDKFYLGNISTQIRASDNPNFAVGSPQTLSATLNIGL